MEMYAYERFVRHRFSEIKKKMEDVTPDSVA